MRRFGVLVLVVGFLAAIVAVIGLSQGWFSVNTQSSGSTSTFEFSVNKDKVAKDTDAMKRSVENAIHHDDEDSTDKNDKNDKNDEKDENDVTKPESAATKTGVVQRVDVEAGSLTLEGESGPIELKVDKSTIVQHGDEPASWNDIRPGDKVIVTCESATSNVAKRVREVD